MEYLGGIFTGLIIGMCIYENRKDKYIKERKEVERLYIKTDNTLDQYKKAYYDLLRCYHQIESALEVYKRTNSNNINVDKDLKEAVKFAMIQSHPDKGGDSEKFVKFRELYNKLK